MKTPIAVASGFNFDGFSTKISGCPNSQPDIFYLEIKPIFIYFSQKNTLLKTSNQRNLKKIAFFLKNICTE